jgi:electron transport complex protein RnfA
MKDFFYIIIGAVLVNNVVLIRTMGVCPLFGASGDRRAAHGMSAAVCLIMVLSTAAAWPVYRLVLVPLGIGYMETVVFVLIIGGLVQLAETAIESFFPALREKLGIYLPLTASNCAVLGLLEQNVREGRELGYSLISALGCGLGFWLVMYLFEGIKSRVDRSDIPESFKGMPSYLIAAAILGLSFMGLTGLLDGLFGM